MGDLANITIGLALRGGAATRQELLDTAAAHGRTMDQIDRRGRQTLSSFRTEQRAQTALMGALGIESPVERIAQRFEYLEFMAARFGTNVSGLLVKAIPASVLGASVALLVKEFKELSDVGAKGFAELGLGSRDFISNIRLAAGWIDETTLRVEKVADAASRTTSYRERQERAFGRAQENIFGPQSADEVIGREKRAIQEQTSAQIKVHLDKAAELEKRRVDVQNLSGSELPAAWEQATGQKMSALRTAIGPAWTMRSEIEEALKKSIEEELKAVQNVSAEEAKRLAELAAKSPGIIQQWNNADAANQKRNADQLNRQRAFYDKQDARIEAQNNLQKARETIALGKLSDHRDWVGEWMQAHGQGNLLNDPAARAAATKAVDEIRRDLAPKIELAQRAQQSWMNAAAGGPMLANAEQMGSVEYQRSADENAIRREWELDARKNAEVLEKLNRVLEKSLMEGAIRVVKVL